MFQDIPMEQVYTSESFSQPYEQLKKEESGAFGNVYKVSYNVTWSDKISLVVDS